MGAVLSKLIDQLNSSVFVLLGILACTGWALYKIGKWTAIFKHHDDKIIKIESLAEKVIIMGTKVDKIEGLAERVVTVGTKVDLIYQIVNPNRVVSSMSPISLTEIGKQIVENIKANVILQKYIQKLAQEVELENPKNAYDIQLASMKVAKERMITFLTEEELAIIKQEAYNRGQLIEDIMSVFGVLLRNHVLNQKGLPISDVDKHAPAPKQT